MDFVLAKVGDLGVQARDLGRDLVVLARTTGPTRALTLQSTKFFEAVFENPGVGEFADHIGRRGNRRQASHAHVNADHRVGLGNAGLLRASDCDSDCCDRAFTLARDRDAKDLRSIKGDESFDTSSVLVGADSPERREREVASVGFQAHSACRKGESVAVPAPLFETRKANASTFDLACSRLLPAPVAVNGSTYAVGEDFLRDLGPPDLAGFSVDAHR